jgi:hypothetical protein
MSADSAEIIWEMEDPGRIFFSINKGDLLSIFDDFYLEHFDISQLNKL